MPRAVRGAVAGIQRELSSCCRSMIKNNLRQAGAVRSRNTRPLPALVWVLCYALLFGAVALQGATSETDPVQTASAERLPDHLLGADPQDRRLDALASVASRKRQLDHKLAEQAQAFDEQRLKAGRYEHALEAARHDIEALKATALDVEATHLSSLAEMKSALASERQKIQTLQDQARADERDRARLAHERLVAVQERDAAKAAVTRAEMTSQRASQQYAALERALNGAQQTWEQTAQIAAADRLALQQALDRTLVMARDLSTATDEIRRLKLREAIRFVRASLPADVAAPMRTVKKRAARSPSKPKPVKVASRKTQQATGFLPASLLPASLLPTRPPLRN